MELEDLMPALSLQEIDVHDLKFWNEFCVTINNNSTPVLYREYSGFYYINAVQEGGRSIASNIVLRENQGLPYTITCTHGSNIQDQTVLDAARLVAENLQIKKPLVLCLCLKDYEVNTIMSFIAEYKYKMSTIPLKTPQN